MLYIDVKNSGVGSRSYLSDNASEIVLYALKVHKELLTVVTLVVPV